MAQVMAEYQAITKSNIDLSVVLWQYPQATFTGSAHGVICQISSKNTLEKVLPHLPGANELNG